MKTSIVGIVLAMLVGCGSNERAQPRRSGRASGGDPDADPEGWQVLAQGTWTLPAPTSGNTDHYYCVYATVPRDIYIKALRPLSPLAPTTRWRPTTIARPPPTGSTRAA